MTIMILKIEKSTDRISRISTYAPTCPIAFTFFFFPSLWYWLIYWVYSIVHVAKSYRHVSRQYTWGQNPCLMSWPNLTTRVYVGPTPHPYPSFWASPAVCDSAQLGFLFIFFVLFKVFLSSKNSRKTLTINGI